MICPNVSWGLSCKLRYEADIVVSNFKGTSTHEIEIKISKSDIKQDKKKKYYHDFKHFKFLWFAVPPELVQVCTEYIPVRAGIFSVDIQTNTVVVIRKAIANPAFIPMPIEMIVKLGYLSSLRYWKKVMYQK